MARLEYQLRVVHEDGSEEQILDPANPTTAPGAFGDKSVLELPDYTAPAWVEAEPRVQGTSEPLSIESALLRTDVTGVLWHSAGAAAGERLPVLVAHDGPEYARFSSLTRYLDHLVDAGTIGPMRAALLAPPGDRNQTYSASASYARSLAHEILPALAEIAPSPPGRAARVGMGASLGALALLHAHRVSPAGFGALFLQSGSYFRQRFDKQEAGFVRFRRISRFVGTVLTARDWMHPITVSMTCGTVEENLANNHAVHKALREQGYDATLVTNRDAHNWVGWRDTFDPHLGNLLAGAWS